MSIPNGKSPSRLFARAGRALVFLSGRTVQFRIAAVVFFGCCCAKAAHAQFYVGALGGVSTLSGDARSLISPGSSAFSSYDPNNGAAVEVVAGRHLSDYFTIQADYIWNRNALTLTSAAFNGTQQAYQETRSSSQQSAMADLLVYFRKRDSRLRPYLSVGTGLVHFGSSRQQIEQALGNPVLPSRHFSSNLLALHVPVGIRVGRFVTPSAKLSPQIPLVIACLRRDSTV